MRLESGDSTEGFRDPVLGVACWGRGRKGSKGRRRKDGEEEEGPGGGGRTGRRRKDKDEERRKGRKEKVKGDRIMEGEKGKGVYVRVRAGGCVRACVCVY